jgi:CO/xanthine dehydrogenase Mo-binding subunit
VAAYRAPYASISYFRFESCLDELARELDVDPLRPREKNAASGKREGAWLDLHQYRVARQTGGC